MTRDPNAALRLLLFGTEDRPVNMSRLAAKMHRHRTTLYNWKDIGRAIGGMK